MTVDAEYNWWGHESGPYHPVTNPAGLGDSVSDYVDYDPWVLTGVNETASPTSPTQFILFQNYPNPFACMTNIQWAIPKSCHTTLRIYNVSGQLVRTLVDEDQTCGNYSARWNGRDDGDQGVAQGIYFYRLEAEDFTSTKKMILLH